MILQDLAEATPERPVRVGRYDVTGLIRAGGMGTVYDAVDRDHGGRVALKTLNRLAPPSLRRFKAEFRSVADLAHPNLVSLYELSCHDDLWFFTMERVEGADLGAALRGHASGRPSTAETVRIRSAPTLVGSEEPEAEAAVPSRRPSPPGSIDAVRAAFAGLARGVRALHAAGLLHLDIKPSNVL
ncbi:MAG TPA: protein kinase, partial [Minicystis sp.]|nr:protein kinase [Minicystis sp.]